MPEILHVQYFKSLDVRGLIAGTILQRYGSRHKLAKLIFQCLRTCRYFYICLCEAHTGHIRTAVLHLRVVRFFSAAQIAANTNQARS